MTQQQRLPGKWGTADSCLEKLCVATPEDLVRNFIERLKNPGADKTRACRPLIWPQVVPGELLSYHTVTFSRMKSTDILQSVGVSVLQKSLKTLSYVSLEGEPAPFLFLPDEQLFKSALSSPGFDPWDGKIPWRRAWQPSPGFLENLMDRGAWWATVHGVAQSRTRMSN